MKECGVHTADDCVLEALREWEAQAVPLFASGEAPVDSWRWMDCIVGNIRLMGKRALLDTRTSDGRRVATAACARLEDRVRERCDKAGVPYRAETCSPSMREESIARLAGKSFELQIVAFHPWSELENLLRSVPLLYDRSLQPYRSARLQCRSVDLDVLSPMALYVLKNRQDEVLELHDALMVNYGLGIWDLSGLLEFRYNSEDVQTIAPLMVEEYVEKDWPGSSQVMGLVDGLHRCMVARSTGLTKVNAVIASDVPFPLVPLPVAWADVHTYDSKVPPEEHMKRRFRYQTLGDFPVSLCRTSVPITESNFRYFFYRDLGVLGSRGKRDFREFESKRAR